MNRRIALLLWCPALAWCAQVGGELPLSAAVGPDTVLVKVAEHRMREARFAAAAVAHGDYLYIIGGSNEDHWVLNTVERLDCRTGAAEDFARLQRGRLWHRAVLVGNTIHVLGGETTWGNAQGQMSLIAEEAVERIDLPTRQVTRGPSWPEARRSFATVLLDGKIHVIGGCLRSDGKVVRTNSTLVFDPTTQRWSPGASMPTSREAEAALIDGPLIVVAGGYNGVEALTAVEVFNPRDGSWRTLPPLCRPASAHALAFLGHHLFFFGHYDAPEQCLAYDLRTRQSEPISVRYKGARHAAAIVHKDKIYVIGGRTDESPAALALVQVFALRRKG